MLIKLFENYLNEKIDFSNVTIQDPNFSIVIPGGCNAKCDFCFWKKNNACKNYLEKLSDVLYKLPENFNQISITGGEPTISPYLKDVLNLIDKNKFNKVVLTTNGHKLLETLNLFENIVDHVNISRHHYDDNINNKIFRSKMIDSKKLKISINELNKIGIDVTLSSVLNEKLKTNNDIKNYINFAKYCGATQIFFRKPHGTIRPSKTERIYENYKYDEIKCPVCRSRYQLIEGMKVVWKSSLIEPSLKLNKIYELIFNESGELTKDWSGKLKININENFDIDNKLNESCGYINSCTSNIIKNIGNRTISDNDIIEILYRKYINNFKENETVIYNKKGHKHYGEEFIFLKKNEKGLAVLKNVKNEFIFIVKPDNIIKKNLENNDIKNFNKIIYNMVENGLLDKEIVDKFFNIKKVDPYEEENWD